MVSATTNIPYIDENGQEQICSNAVELIGSDAAITLESGWYLASSILNFLNTITVDGDVHIILADECELTINGDSGKSGINVQGTNALTIYAQSNDSSMGSLTSTGGKGGAGIGGGEGIFSGSYDIPSTPGGSCGIVTINGGNVKANGGAGIGAGIGGGAGGWRFRGGNGGAITVNGGVVTAIGGYSAGIGGGAGGITSSMYDGLGGDGGVVTINGGVVIATGDRGVGIGAGVGYGGGGGAGGGWGATGTLNMSENGNGVVFASSVLANTEGVADGIIISEGKILFATTTPDKADIIIAFYDGGKLISIETEPIIENGKIENVEIPQKSTTIKIMLWNGLNTMQPLREARTFTNDGSGWKLGK